MIVGCVEGFSGRSRKIGREAGLTTGGGAAIDDGGVDRTLGEPGFDFAVGHVGRIHAATVLGGYDSSRPDHPHWMIGWLLPVESFGMEIKRYEDAAAFEFADFTLREMAPDAVEEASMAEILLPIGADRPPRISRKLHRIYVVLAGEIEFSVNEQPVRLSRGDTLYVAQGEQYGFHNGGYEEGRMLLIRMPGPALPENA